MKKQYQDKDIPFDDLDESVLPTALATMPSSVMNALYHQTKKMMGRMVDYKELRMIYACAMKEIKTKFDILNTEFSLQYHRNPINSIQTRLKSTASIVEKLAKLWTLNILMSIYTTSRVSESFAPISTTSIWLPKLF